MAFEQLLTWMRFAADLVEMSKIDPVVMNERARAERLFASLQAKAIGLASK